MARSSRPLRTDTELRKPITIPQLAGVIADADPPTHRRLVPPRSHDGVESPIDSETLPSFRTADAFVDTAGVTASRDESFEAWPALVQTLSQHRQRGGKIWIDAETVRSVGARTYGDGDTVTLRSVYGPISTEISTVDGILAVRCCANADVFMSISDRFDGRRWARLCRLSHCHRKRVTAGTRTPPARRRDACHRSGALSGRRQTDDALSTPGCSDARCNNCPFAVRLWTAVPSVIYYRTRS